MGTRDSVIELLTSLHGDGVSRSRTNERPFVTLTWAQSLDGSIAMKSGKAVPISGRESWKMTHSLRAWHDGILVGVGTAVNDNPSLTTRLVRGPSPRPIILDPHLRIPLSIKSLSDPARKPVLLCSAAVLASELGSARAKAISERGVAVIGIKGSSPPKESSTGVPYRHTLSWYSILSAVSSIGVKRLMVEGGARVIAGLLSEHQHAAVATASSSGGMKPGGSAPGAGLVDATVTTISPFVIPTVAPLPRLALAAPGSPTRGGEHRGGTAGASARGHGGEERGAPGGGSSGGLSIPWTMEFTAGVGSGGAGHGPGHGEAGAKAASPAQAGLGEGSVPGTSGAPAHTEAALEQEICKDVVSGRVSSEPASGGTSGGIEGKSSSESHAASKPGPGDHEPVPAVLPAWIQYGADIVLVRTPGNMLGGGRELF